MIQQEKLDALGPGLADIVNRVSARLTNDVMVEMNAAVDVEQQDAASVAGAFLEANGLLG